MIELSVVIPIYNESSLIGELYNRVSNSLLKFIEDFEVIMIDDGSSDDSLARMISINAKDKRFKILQLSRNFGLQAAYTAGLSHAQGKYVVMMDGDLQDPPEVIQEMFEAIKNSDNDIIYARRKSRKEVWYRKILMKMFHSIFTKVLKSDASDNVGNFSLFKETVKDAILAFAEKTRYLPGIRSQVGFKQGYVLYDREKRFSGEPKMNLARLFSLALDAIFSFSNFPIRFMLTVGFTGVVISVIGFVYIIASKIMGVAPTGWSSTLFFIFLFSSLQITFLGIIGEYIFRIYKETQNRPIFIVKDFIK